MVVALIREEKLKKREFFAKSESLDGAYYLITEINGESICSCPDFQNRKRSCKHIREKNTFFGEDF